MTLRVSGLGGFCVRNVKYSRYRANAILRVNSPVDFSVKGTV
jgi:hypothetical protein